MFRKSVRGFPPGTCSKSRAWSLLCEPTNSKQAPAELRDWLAKNHTQAESVWLVTYKKQAPDKYVSPGVVLDELICFGWIDGIRRQLDEDRTMQLIARRKTQHWAKSYKDRAHKLTNEGRMHEAGWRSIAKGKANGLWAFMDDVDALIQPDDLRNAFAAQPTAAAFFNASASPTESPAARLSF